MTAKNFSNNPSKALPLIKANRTALLVTRHVTKTGKGLKGYPLAPVLLERVCQTRVSG
jgi:hypothetical protein